MINKQKKSYLRVLKVITELKTFVFPSEYYRRFILDSTFLCLSVCVGAHLQKAPITGSSYEYRPLDRTIEDLRYVGTKIGNKALAS